jgi:hypothetical protein
VATGGPATAKDELNLSLIIKQLSKSAVNVNQTHRYGSSGVSITFHFNARMSQPSGRIRHEECVIISVTAMTTLPYMEIIWQ